MKFYAHNALAIDPKAFGADYVSPVAIPPNRRIGTTAIVSVRGPLAHHEDPFFDSYAAVKARVLDALAGKPGRVILAIDSPGGLVAGMLEAADSIRAACAAAKVPLEAHIGGTCASAAYAIACAAGRIVASPTGIVGSIGVIDALIDATAQDRSLGLAYSIVASGARKSDGLPHAAVSSGAIVAMQARVDSLAGIFAAHVARARRLTPAAVAGQNAALYVGADAVRAGLVDAIGTLESLTATARPVAPIAPKITARAAKPPQTSPTQIRKDTTMAASLLKYRRAISALTEFDAHALGRLTVALKRAPTTGEIFDEITRLAQAVTASPEREQMNRAMGVAKPRPMVERTPGNVAFNLPAARRNF